MDAPITKPWGDPSKAKVMVIGHDPRLQKSATLAQYALFADYYFRPEPADKKEVAKFNLARGLVNCVTELTSGMVSPEEVLVTNLCNEPLRRPAGRKVVLIPEETALDGLNNIRVLLERSRVKLIFAMSQQVNYWLQRLGFCPEDALFLEDARPKALGAESNPPYYEPTRGKAFMRICGKQFVADGKYYLFPILHVKNYPPKGSFLAYEQQYAHCRMEIKRLARFVQL